MQQSDCEYYRARAVQEQLAAMRAGCPTARRCHEELATMYRFKAGMLSKPLRPSGEKTENQASLCSVSAFGI
jgi:hypothetical protein